jgi:hypothetical protein
MEEEVLMRAIDILYLVLDSIQITELLLSMYLCYGVIKDMDEDIKYSVTRIFLSQRSVKGMKALMISLIVYAIFNIAIVFFLSGTLLYIMIRVNIIILFGGLLYYFWQISRVTKKRSK